MKTIYKYELDLRMPIVLQIPGLQKILCVQMQGKTPCLWALVEKDKPTESVAIRIFGTGHPINDSLNLEYINTFQVEDGLLIFHAFKGD